MKAYLYHRSTGRIYEVTSLDREAKTIGLRNDMAAFTETYDRDRFKAQGYMMVQGEDEVAARDTARAKIEAEQEAA
jgi:hypothetical protein